MTLNSAVEDEQRIMEKKPPGSEPDQIRILLVGEHSMVCAGLAQLINQEQDLSVCGHAQDQHEALEAIPN